MGLYVIISSSSRRHRGGAAYSYPRPPRGPSLWHRFKIWLKSRKTT